MDLADHLDQPTMLDVAGQRLGFSELPLASQARLQAWIKANVPHPLAAVREHLEGFGAEDRALLLEAARKEAMHWPPAIGSPEALNALMKAQGGIVATLHEGLKVHQPQTTLADAERVFRKIRGDEPLSRRIFALIFGTDPEDTEATGPKGSGAPSPSTGT